MPYIILRTMNIHSQSVWDRVRARRPGRRPLNHAPSLLMARYDARHGCRGLAFAPRLLERVWHHCNKYNSRCLPSPFPPLICLTAFFFNLCYFLHLDACALSKQPTTMASNQFDSQASTNYKEAFALFDKRGNGRCTVDSLGDLLRACGQNPTLSEIDDLQKGLGPECE